MDHLPSEAGSIKISGLHITFEFRLSNAFYHFYLICLISLALYAIAPGMTTKSKYPAFNAVQLNIVNQAVSMAEELVSNYYKMSLNEWLRPKYDIKTISDLASNEIVEGPFAQLFRYQGKRKGSSLGSGSYDFYKICVQDHTILATLKKQPELSLVAFCLYIITHELIHIVRFSKFLQNFEASAEEKLAEEKRVHTLTHEILAEVPMPELTPVLAYYHQWR